MSHSAPVTKQEFQGFVDEIRGELAALSAQLRPASGSVQTVNLPPAPPPQRSERMVPLLVSLIVLLMMALIASLSTASLQGQRITDMRADFARDIDRLERRHEALGAWSREESNITRGYIWTGKVPVANPYPKEDKL